jgi:tetratricopeptide (TPR) repeat protein
MNVRGLLVRPGACLPIALVGALALTPAPARADEADEAFRNGVRLLGEHKPREAEEAFHKVLRLDPNYPEVFIYLGDALLQLKDYNGAIDCYQKSLGADRPDESGFRALNGLGCAFLGLATGPKAQDHIRDAIRCFDRVIELSPKFVAAYNNRGRAYHLKKDLDRAITEFSKAIELDPACADAYENRGKAWKDKGDQKRADADEAKARELRAKKK